MFGKELEYQIEKKRKTMLQSSSLGQKSNQLILLATSKNKSHKSTESGIAKCKKLKLMTTNDSVFYFTCQYT